MCRSLFFVWYASTAICGPVRPYACTQQMWSYRLEATSTSMWASLSVRRNADYQPKTASLMTL
eukprot:5645727-Amphidinium_carterae.1